MSSRSSTNGCVCRKRRSRGIIAVLWPPSREPVVPAVFHAREVADAKPDDAVIAGAARIVAETFGRF
ncbi:beta-lactamase class A [Paraburkholderia caballeronis]|uniref:Beta-lactamase class A n=1 Tax=Paraburkholderia caballeronis TaxID=416943 RepID=A0A1H7SAT6_9BURK|nr:hypothetical protein C7403_112190 [Paraburkholderia caballeronis]PXW97374.1 hypothetical protein C7407_112190 [Paraburkholderia caballeronis]RAJ93894.1 hypothetical protein C7409_112190 [Paraburkholderia caballeronis]SEL69613.1 beta-lactamase class A [Paraburkholderia caballeronis]